MRYVQGFRSVLGIAIAMVPCYAGGISQNGWGISSDGRSDITTMTIADPATYTKTEARFTFTFGSDPTPTAGNIEYRDGISRKMTDTEVSLYWNLCGGPKAEFEYYRSMNRLTTFVPGQNKNFDPYQFGSLSRVMVTTGTELFGKIGTASESGMFTLMQDGVAPMKISLVAVKEIEAISKK